MRTNEAGVTGSKRGRGAEELAEAVELARAKSKLRASKTQEPERVGLPDLDFGSKEDYLEGLALAEHDREHEEAVQKEEQRARAAALARAGLAEGEVQAEASNEVAEQHWQEAQDPSSGCLYYYHTDRNLTQWERPEEGYISVHGVFMSPEAVAVMARQQRQQQEALQAEQRSGWCYKDAFGFKQGPFNGDQLRTWASAAQLPLETEIWFQQAGGGGKEPLRMELRQLIGDEGERAAARQQPHRPYQDQQREGGAVHGEQSSSYAEYAAAALAGLPQEDEAVKIAQLAAAAGQTVEDMLQFSYASGSHSADPKASGGAPVAKALYNPRTGRIERAPEGEEEVNVYLGMESWVDINSLEDSLKAMSARKGKQLPPDVWKKLKARRQEIKGKVRRQGASWLYQ